MTKSTSASDADPANLCLRENRLRGREADEDRDRDDRNGAERASIRRLVDKQIAERTLLA